MRDPRRRGHDEGWGMGTTAIPRGRAAQTPKGGIVKKILRIWSLYGELETDRPQKTSKRGGPNPRDKREKRLGGE